ncbi:hypothetical protein LUZ60_007443 [Juncus effusus]|nr:hypothetical protein LUZ60_007443 [Juncus effusus]
MKESNNQRDFSKPHHSCVSSVSNCQTNLHHSSSLYLLSLFFFLFSYLLSPSLCEPLSLSFSLSLNMTTCGSLRSLFEKPLPENPTLMESLSSWQNLTPTKPLDPASFTEIFGELHFSENPLTSSIFSLKPLKSRQLCTEGLGSESSDDVDDLVMNEESETQEFNTQFKEKMELERRELKFSSDCNNNNVKSKSTKEFPPPISSIGKAGKPAVCFKAYREEGRFVLREIRIPTHEYLRASRRDGRLKLRFICPDEEIVEGEEEEDEGEGQNIEEMERGEEEEEIKMVF